MFKVKKIEINAAHEMVAMILEKDAIELNINPNERVKLINPLNNKSVICVLDIIDYKKIKGSQKDCKLKSGEIGIFEKAFDKLEIVENKKINLVPAQKPKSLEHIKSKFEGNELKLEHFEEIIKDIVENRYSSIETTYFVLTCAIQKLNDKETVNLTKAMITAGKVLDFTTKENNKIVVDKHCVGGVPANRTSMVIVPIIAAAGLTIPKSSSRSITSPAGTADTMEVFAKVDLPISDMFNEVKKLNGCIVWGGALDLSPADDLIIHIEHPLELDSEEQMIASILSKKKSVGSTHVLIDIPIGPTAKITSFEKAKKLKDRFKKIGKAIGLKIKVIITNGSEPVGNGIGPYYEAMDVLKVLKNEKDAPQDLREKSLMIAAEIFEMSGKIKPGKGLELATKILDSQLAYKKFEQIIKFQGKKKMPKPAQYRQEIRATKDDTVKYINNQKINKLAFILGAPQDKVAGLILHKKVGDKVKKNDLLLEMFSNSELKMKYGFAYLKDNKICGWE